MHRKTTARTLRHLEREIRQLEADITRLLCNNSHEAQQRIRLIHERLTLARAWLEREREHLQRHMMACVHGELSAPFDDSCLAPDPLDVMQNSFARFARYEKQLYTLLYMHVIKEKSVQEIAELQGVSRSAVYRSLTQAKIGPRKMCQAMTP
jgi:DNA-binding transcriptional regulator GbsR (MarR family)